MRTLISYMFQPTYDELQTVHYAGLQ